MQRNLDHAAVRDDHDVALRMAAVNAVERRASSRIKQRGAFTTRRQVPIRLLDPPGPCVGETLGDLFSTQPFPFAQEDLAQRRIRIRFHADGGADQLRGLKRSLQVAGIKPGESTSSQSPANPRSLAAPLIRKRGVELALDAMVSVPRRLAVADEHQARWGRTSG